MGRITTKDLTTAMGLLAAVADRVGVGPGADVRWAIKRNAAPDPYVLYWVSPDTAWSRCPLFPAGSLGATARQAWDTLHAVRTALQQVEEAQRRQVGAGD